MGREVQSIVRNDKHEGGCFLKFSPSLSASERGQRGVGGWRKGSGFERSCLRSRGGPFQPRPLSLDDHGLMEVILQTPGGSRVQREEPENDDTYRRKLRHKRPNSPSPAAVKDASKKKPKLQHETASLPKPLQRVS
jgi:hypothetical protein